jgi:hypothetical protein
MRESIKLLKLINNLIIYFKFISFLFLIINIKSTFQKLHKISDKSIVFLKNYFIIDQISIFLGIQSILRDLRIKNLVMIKEFLQTCSICRQLN